jgi:hypothetical protein
VDLNREWEAPGDGAPEPITSTERRVPAIWNMASGAGRQVVVLGLWATWPAEPVRGLLVADRFASFRSMYCSGSNPLTSHANRTGNLLASNFVIGAAPERPSINERQVVATSLPTGEMAPTPVTTTRRFVTP